MTKQKILKKISQDMGWEETHKQMELEPVADMVCISGFCNEI
jgi:hypothetical protein